MVTSIRVETAECLHMEPRLISHVVATDAAARWQRDKPRENANIKPLINKLNALDEIEIMARCEAKVRRSHLLVLRSAASIRDAYLQLHNSRSAVKQSLARLADPACGGILSRLHASDQSRA